MKPEETELASIVIGLLGGTSKTAEMCDVTRGAVSQWRKTRIPKAQLKFICAARPDISKAITAASQTSFLGTNRA